MNLKNIAVRHDQEHRMFFIKLNGGAAYLKYQTTDKNVLDIVETHVPEEFRGNGVAGRLVEYAISYAKGLNMEIKLSCSFANDYVKKNEVQMEQLESSLSI